MKQIGVLTSGGDCPGLNAALRGVVRAGQESFNMHFVGFRDGFRGLVHDRTLELTPKVLSGVLTDGGADVILIPEIPYDVEVVARAIRRHTRRGKTFSIVVVAEGAMSQTQAQTIAELVAAKEQARKKTDKKAASEQLDKFHEEHVNHTMDLTSQLEGLTGLESRLTILGHLQRGGTPFAADRVLATRLGTGCAELLSKNVYGVMVAARGEGVEPVPLEEVAGKKKLVPMDHPWVRCARHVGTCLGDQI